MFAAACTSVCSRGQMCISLPRALPLSLHALTQAQLSSWLVSGFVMALCCVRPWASKSRGSMSAIVSALRRPPRAAGREANYKNVQVYEASV